MELPLTFVLADIEAVGIAVDTRPAARPAVRARRRRSPPVEQEAHAVVGRPFNLGSPKQLQEILFDQFGLPKTKRIKTGYTTDADALAGLYEQTGHPLLELLLRHREVARLKTVVDSLLPLIDDAGRIHTTFNQTIAATGRLSSTDPNLQNIPVRTAEGRRIREAFVVGAGYESLMTADYSQIEMRIMAHLSRDAGLIEAFKSGEDLHTFVASRAFDLPIDAVDPDLRRRVKAMTYGLVYGLSAFGLSQQLKITPGRGPRPDGGLLRPLRRRARLPALGRRRRSDERLHRDDHGSAPLPARPDQRQPPAPRDGRADGAQRADPGQRRRHHQGGDARRAPRAGRRRVCGRGCCCRCTTSSCSRWRRASARRSRRWCGPRWAPR